MPEEFIFESEDIKKIADLLENTGRREDFVKRRLIKAKENICNNYSDKQMIEKY